jgi:hypothetical protein
VLYLPLSNSILSLARLRTLYTNLLLLLLVKAVLPLLLARQFRSTARVRIIVQNPLSKINFTRYWNLGGVFSRVFLLCELTKCASRMQRIALVTSIVNFFVSILLWGDFDRSASRYQFVQELQNLSFCHVHIVIDGISL